MVWHWVDVTRAGEPYQPRNGTEADIFMDEFCWRCKKLSSDDWPDDEFAEVDCPILQDSYVYDKDDPHYPCEWRHDRTGKPVCTAFEPRDGRHKPSVFQKPLFSEPRESTTVEHEITDSDISEIANLVESLWVSKYLDDHERQVIVLGEMWERTKEMMAKIGANHERTGNGTET